MLNNKEQEFPKVEATKSSRAIRSSSAVCDLVTIFLEKERTKVDFHGRVSYWEDLLGLTRSIATTEKQRSRLSQLDEKPLDLDALEIIPGSDSTAEAESNDLPESEEMIANNSSDSKEDRKTLEKIKKEEKKKRKAAKKEKKEAKKIKSES